MRVRDAEIRRFAGGLGALAVAILLVLNASAIAAAPDFIRAEGTRLVDAAGGRVTLTGINVGSGLVPEGDMFKFMRARAPAEIAGVIEALIGPHEASRF